MSTKTNFMHYMKWSRVTSNFKHQGICTTLQFFAFFFAVSFLIGIRSKIWGAQTPFLPSFYGSNS